MYQYICIPFPQIKKKPLKTRPPQKKERNLPTTKNHQFSVENSWKIQGNLPRLEPWNPPTQIASMDRWVNRQGRLTCVGFYSQGLNHFSSIFFLHEKTWNKKNIYTFFLAFLWFSLSITGRFSFFFLALELSSISSSASTSWRLSTCVLHRLSRKETPKGTKIKRGSYRFIIF